MYRNCCFATLLRRYKAYIISALGSDRIRFLDADESRVTNVCSFIRFLVFTTIVDNGLTLFSLLPTSNGKATFEDNSDAH